MIKTHEKSRLHTVLRTSRVNGSDDIILQIEQTPLLSDGAIVYLVESVSKEDYDRTTAEGKAAAAEAELAAEIEAHKIEMEEAQAKIDALEELLEKARDTREGMRNAVEAVREENKTLYKALVECHRIFGELPPEIERLLNNKEGEKDHGYTCTI